MPFKGLDKAIDQVAGLEKVPQVAATVMQNWLIMIGTEAAVMTPIDTSTLLNSQFKMQSATPTAIVGRIGYNAHYAIYTHDPKYPMNFRRATAEKEYLLKAINNTASMRLKLLDGMIRKMMT